MQKPAKHSTEPCDLRRLILDAVARLHEAPPIRAGDVDADDDDDQVKLDGQWLSLSLVRETLLNEEGFLEEQFRQRVPLEWLEFPQGRAGGGQTELPRDQYQVDNSLRVLADRAATSSEAYAILLLEARKQPRDFHAEISGLGESILRTLGGVSQSIRGGLSRELRRRGEALFAIEKTGGGHLEGRWMGVDESINLEALFVNEGQLVGNLNDSDARALAHIVFDALAERQLTLPGFRAFDSAPDRVVLVWTRAKIQALD